MVMLTLARFVGEKFGGDSMAELCDNLERYRERVARAPEASLPGGGGVGEAGSGGDD
jgi:hypothetical protein